MSEIKQSKPEYEEILEQYIVREKTYLEKWVELSHTAQAYQGLRDLIVKEQIIETCPRDLSVYLQERIAVDLEEMARSGEKFLEAHGRHLHQGAKLYSKVKPDHNKINQESANNITKRDSTCYN